jgi:hypothetical protein
LFGLAGEVVNGQVELFAPNFTLSDLDQAYLFGVRCKSHILLYGLEPGR